MTTKNIDTTKTESAGAADTPEEETALVDSEDALRAELGLGAEEDASNLETDEETDTDTETETETEETEETETDEVEATEETEEEDTETDEEDADFSKIPEEVQPMVGALIKKARDKERAKVEAKLAELTETAETAETLTAERADLQGQLDALKAQKAVPAPSQDDPYADIVEAKQLTDLEEGLWRHRRELLTDPDGVMVSDGKGGKRELRDGEANQRLAIIDERLNRNLPAKRRQLEANAVADKQLAADFPELARADSDVSRAVNRVLAGNPNLKLVPGYRRIALAQALGEAAMAKHGKGAWGLATGKAKPADPAKKPGAQTPPRRAPKPEAGAATAPKRSGPKNTNGKFDEDAFTAEILGG